MGVNGGPGKELTSRELLRLARSIERQSIQRRKFMAKVEELNASIREARRLFRQLADQLGVDAVEESLRSDLRELP